MFWVVIPARAHKVTSNPLGDVEEWLGVTGKGADFIIKIGSCLIAVENKFAESLTLKNVTRHVEPRFLTDKEGSPLRKVHYKILLLTNDETYICPSVREYLKKKGIKVMTAEELKQFLIEIAYSHYRHYGYLRNSRIHNNLHGNRFGRVGSKYGSGSYYNLISSDLEFG